MTFRRHWRIGRSPTPLASRLSLSTLTLPPISSLNLLPASSLRMQTCQSIRFATYSTSATTCAAMAPFSSSAPSLTSLGSCARNTSGTITSSSREGFLCPCSVHAVSALDASSPSIQKTMVWDGQVSDAFMKVVDGTSRRLWHTRLTSSIVIMGIGSRCSVLYWFCVGFNALMFDVFNYIPCCNATILNDTFNSVFANCAWLTILRTSWTCLVTIIFDTHTLYVCSRILHITVIIVASVALDFAHRRHCL